MSNPPIGKLSPKEYAQIVSNRALRIKLAKKSPFWFFHIYFYAYIEHATADFQREIFNNLSDESIRHLVIVSFRGSAKSTIATMVFPLWSIISGRKHFVIIASQTQPQAHQHLRNIRNEIEANELFRNDFGNLDEASNEWGTSSLSLSKFKAKIMTASRGQNIRGLRHGSHRPDLIICDDIEDIDSVKTAESRRETFRWFNSEVMGIGSLKTHYVTVGNLLHEDSLVMRLKSDFAAGTRGGTYTEYPFMTNGKALWSGMYPDKAAIDKRKGDFDYITWMREFMLQIIAEENQIVTRSMIKTYDHIPERLRGQSENHYVGVDLAISMKDTADYTAIVSLLVRSLPKNRMQIYVLPRPINERMSFHQTIDTMLEIHNEQPSRHFVIETNGYQDAAAQSLKSYGVKVTGVKSINDKRTRLNIVADKIDRGIILFPSKGCELLVSQITGFGVERHDDLMDAFTIAAIEIVNSSRRRPSTVRSSGRRKSIYRRKVWR